MKCLRLVLLAACVASSAGDAARTIAPEPLVLYVDEKLPRTERLLRDIDAGLARIGVTARHPVHLELYPADVASERSLHEQLKGALARRPAIIVASNSNVAVAAKALASDVPIIFASHQDPIAVRLAQSLASPGNNMTGFTYFVPVHEKRLELLRQVAPRAKKLGVVVDRWWLAESGGAAAIHAAHEKLGFDVTLFQVETEADVALALDTPAAHGMEAWYVPMTRLAYEHPETLATSIAGMSRPAVFHSAQFVERGGLLAYQQLLSRDDAVALFAKMIGLVLDGVPAGEIPIERPKAFELVVNADRARHLGIELPEALLKRADRVISAEAQP